MDTTVSVSDTVSDSVTDTVSDSVIDNTLDYNSELLSIYTEECNNLPQVKIINDNRKKAINKFKKTFTLEQFREICKRANKSSFLTGNNDRNWKADLDFLLRTDKATKILEGFYDGSNKPPGGNIFLDMLREG